MSLFTELETDLEIMEFSECIDQCVSCDVLVTLRQKVETANDLDDVKVVTLQTQTFESTNEVEIPNNGFVYLRIRAFAEEYKKLYSLWDTVQKRGTTRYRQGYDNDYILCVDLIKEDEKNNKAYRLTFIAPIFIGKENGLYADDNTLILVFRGDACESQVEDVDYVAVYDAEQYANELARQRVDEESDEEDNEDFFDPNDEEEYENEDIISTDDITSNDDFLL